MSGEATRERELLPLRLINDNYEKIVLSMDKSFIKSYEGIKAVNIIDFLLEEQKGENWCYIKKKYKLKAANFPSLTCSHTISFASSLNCSYDAEPMDGFFGNIVKQQLEICERDFENKLWKL